MSYPFPLPELGYDYDALEPHIDARTMEIHHQKHHGGYTAKFNAALENHPQFHGVSAEHILRGFGGIPAEIQDAVRNNGGGVLQPLPLLGDHDSRRGRRTRR